MKIYGASINDNNDDDNDYYARPTNYTTKLQQKFLRHKSEKFGKCGEKKINLKVRDVRVAHFLRRVRYIF